MIHKPNQNQGWINNKNLDIFNSQKQNPDFVLMYGVCPINKQNELLEWPTGYIWHSQLAVFLAGDLLELREPPDRQWQLTVRSRIFL